MLTVYNRDKIVAYRTFFYHRKIVFKEKPSCLEPSPNLTPSLPSKSQWGGGGITEEPYLEQPLLSKKNKRREMEDWQQPEEKVIGK